MLSVSSVVKINLRAKPANVTNQEIGEKAFNPFGISFFKTTERTEVWLAPNYTEKK